MTIERSVSPLKKFHQDQTLKLYNTKQEKADFMSKLKKRNSTQMRSMQGREVSNQRKGSQYKNLVFQPQKTDYSVD